MPSRSGRPGGPRCQSLLDGRRPREPRWPPRAAVKAVKELGYSRLADLPPRLSSSRASFLQRPPAMVAGVAATSCDPDREPRRSLKGQERANEDASLDPSRDGCSGWSGQPLSCVRYQAGQPRHRAVLPGEWTQGRPVFGDLVSLRRTGAILPLQELQPILHSGAVRSVWAGLPWRALLQAQLAIDPPRSPLCGWGVPHYVREVHMSTPAAIHDPASLAQASRQQARTRARSSWAQLSRAAVSARPRSAG